MLPMLSLGQLQDAFLTKCPPNSYWRCLRDSALDHPAGSLSHRAAGGGSFQFSAGAVSPLSSYGTVRLTVLNHLLRRLSGNRPFPTLCCRPLSRDKLPAL